MLKKHKVALQSQISTFESPRRSIVEKPEPDPFTDGSELQRYKSKVQNLAKKNEQYNTMFENFGGWGEAKYT